MRLLWQGQGLSALSLEAAQGERSRSLFTPAVERGTGVSKIVKKLGKYGQTLIPMKATGFHWALLPHGKWDGSAPSL